MRRRAWSTEWRWRRSSTPFRATSGSARSPRSRRSSRAATATSSAELLPGGAGAPALRPYRDLRAQGEPARKIAGRVGPDPVPQLRQAAEAVHFVVDVDAVDLTPVESVDHP